MFLDSHCHLADDRFEGERKEIIERARAAGLRRLLTISTTPAELQLNLSLAEVYDFISVAAAIHPHEASIWSEGVEREFTAFYDHPDLVAIGEIGLDFWYDTSPREEQEMVFRRFLRIARARRKPVIIHLRDPKEGPPLATDRFRRILDEETAGGAIRGVMHCFSGTLSFAREMVDRGFLISIPGILTFPKAGELKEVATALPLDSLLVETDCPYLAPVPHRGKRNEPAYVTYTAEELARLRGIPPEVLDTALTANFQSLFGV